MKTKKEAKKKSNIKLEHVSGRLSHRRIDLDDLVPRVHGHGTHGHAHVLAPRGVAHADLLVLVHGAHHRLDCGDDGALEKARVRAGLSDALESALVGVLVKLLVELAPLLLGVISPEDELASGREGGVRRG